MKYLVLKQKLEREQIIKFIVFNGPGFHLTVSSERCYVPYYVRQYQNYQMGVFSVNENINYRGGTVFTIVNVGCNIKIDGEQLLPQGISVLEQGKTYSLENLTMFLIDEDEKAEVEADFNMQMLIEDEERNPPPPSPPAVVDDDDDDGYDECEVYDEYWD